MPRQPGAEAPLPADVTGAIPGQAPARLNIAEQTADQLVRILTHTTTSADDRIKASTTRNLAALRKGFQPAADARYLKQVITSG